MVSFTVAIHGRETYPKAVFAGQAADGSRAHQHHFLYVKLFILINFVHIVILKNLSIQETLAYDTGPHDWS